MFYRKKILPHFFIILLTIFSFTACASDDTSIAKIESDPTSYVDSQELKVSFLDVGQGDSIFLELPEHETMLIDAGNPGDADSVENYIKNAGYDRIDYVVGTHPHNDHIGGMAEIIRDFDIGSIYMPKASNSTSSFETLLSEILNHNYNIISAKAGKEIINDENFKISILAPVEDSYEELNDYSAVIKVSFGTTSFLFMGDAESLSESQIKGDVKADVIKIGHHGSESSSSPSFIDRVSPSYAVISVGAGNMYGHPSNKTLDTLSSRDIITYRTDYDGTIIFTSNGSEISVDQSPSDSFTVHTPFDDTDVIPDPLVYVTDTGTKYHREDCRYLNKSKIPMPLSEAILLYEPCSQCSPPK